MFFGTFMTYTTNKYVWYFHAHMDMASVGDVHMSAFSTNPECANIRTEVKREPVGKFNALVNVVWTTLHNV